MCVVAAACVAFLVILAVHAVVVAAVAVALLFAAVSEGRGLRYHCAVGLIVECVHVGVPGTMLSLHVEFFTW